MRAITARLDHRVAVQTAHDVVAHGVDPVPAHHAFGAVEVELVQLAGVEHARDARREFVGQRRVRLRVEGDVALLQVVGLRACGMGGGPCLEGSARAGFEGVRRFAREFGILDDLAADADRITVAGVGEDRVVAHRGRLVDVQHGVGRRERAGQRIAVERDQMRTRYRRDPRVARIDARGQGVDADPQSGVMDAGGCVLHVRQAAREIVGAHRIVAERLPPAVQVDRREAAAPRDFDPVVSRGVREIGKEIGAAHGLGLQRPGPAAARERHARVHRHRAQHGRHPVLGAGGESGAPAGEPVLRGRGDLKRVATDLGLDRQVVAAQADGVGVV